MRATAEGLEVLGPIVDGQPLLSATQCDGGTVVRLTDEQRQDVVTSLAPESASALERRAAGLKAAELSTYGCEHAGGGMQPDRRRLGHGPPDRGPCRGPS